MQNVRLPSLGRRKVVLTGHPPVVVLPRHVTYPLPLCFSIIP